MIVYCKQHEYYIDWPVAWPTPHPLCRRAFVDIPQQQAFVWGGHTINKFVGKHGQYLWFQAKLFDPGIGQRDIERFILGPNLASSERIGQCIQPFLSELRGVDFEQDVTGCFEMAVTA